MPILSDTRIAELLTPYLADHRPSTGNSTQFADIKELTGNIRVYLDLLLRWNARTNLTSVREPEEIVRRHFGESLFAASALQNRLSDEATVLDFGSGAGFPGLPLQLALPAVRVTLAESQGKKAAFLREAVRTLGLKTEVWAGRVEAMPAERRFDCVTLRAVDRMDAASAEARRRVKSEGTMAILAGELEIEEGAMETLAIPESDRRRLYLIRL